MGKGTKKKFVKLDEFEEKRKNIPQSASDKNKQLSFSDKRTNQQKTGNDSCTDTSETNATETQPISYPSSNGTYKSECKNTDEKEASSQSEIDNSTESAKTQYEYRDRNMRTFNQHSNQSRGRYSQTSANRHKPEDDFSHQKTKHDDGIRERRQWNQQNNDSWGHQTGRSFRENNSVGNYSERTGRNFSGNHSTETYSQGDRRPTAGRSFRENNSVGNYSERTGRNFSGNNSTETFWQGDRRPTAGRGRPANDSYVEGTRDQRRNHSNYKQSSQGVWNNDNSIFKQESSTQGYWRTEKVGFQKPGDPEPVAEETDFEKTLNNETTSSSLDPQKPGDPEPVAEETDFEKTQVNETNSSSLNPTAPSFSPLSNEYEWDGDETEKDIIIEKTNITPQSYEQTNDESNTQSDPQSNQDSFVDSKKDNSSHSSKEIDSALENMSFDSDEHSYIPSHKNFKEKHTARPSSQKQYDYENQPMMSRPSRQSLNNLSNSVRNDKEWDGFMDFMNSKNVNKYDKVIERDQDLFTIDEAYSLAHCVAEDMNMGSGIAVEFRRKFKQVDALLQQRQRAGGIAFLEDKNRYIYYLVTKPESSGKPTYATLWSSLKKMRQYIEEHGVKKLAIPRIGCGLDRLEWNVVKPMLEYLFSNLDIEIIVCNFQQEDTITRARPRRSCRIVYEKYAIADIAEMTIIVYFASKDGIPSEVMIALDKKFHFLTEFKASRKNLGEVIYFDKRKDFLLCGCIVKETVEGLFDFKHFNKCLQTIQSRNKKDLYEYVGFESLKDQDDPMLNAKILNLMRHTLTQVDIHCCNFSTESSILED